ncbi:MAG: hypothetical protein ABJB97_01620 [Acidobacteriota bacterium]
MTPEARLDRLERIAKLFVKAGLRARSHMRELDEKFNMLVAMQMANDGRFARNEERSTRNEARFDERFSQTEERLAKLAAETDRKFVEMAEAQAIMVRTFSDLMEFLRRKENTTRPVSDN